MSNPLNSFQSVWAVGADVSPLMLTSVVLGLLGPSQAPASEPPSQLLDSPEVSRMC